MTRYAEVAAQIDQEAFDAKDRDETIHEAVCAALEVIDEKYPQFKKSAGPMGDKLAGQLDRVIQTAMAEVLQLQQEEIDLLEVLKRKYPRS